MAARGLAYIWPPEIDTGGTFTLGTAVDGILRSAYFGAPTSGGVAGQVTATLAPATGAGTGALVLSGTVARSLAPATGAGTGALVLSGTVARSLAPATGAGTGALVLSGTVARSLAPATGAGTGALVLSGTVARSLAPATCSARGRFVTPLTGARRSILSVRPRESSLPTRTVATAAERGASPRPVIRAYATASRRSPRQAITGRG